MLHLCRRFLCERVACSLRRWWYRITAPTWGNSATPRRRRNRIAQRTFNARQTCSKVTCGFFPPKPLRMQRHETKDYQGQYQMADQTLILPTLIVHQTHFLFTYPEAVFNRRPPKRYRQQPAHRLAGRIAHQVLHLGGRFVDGHDQHVPLSRHPHQRARRPPHLVRRDGKGDGKGDGHVYYAPWSLSAFLGRPRGRSVDCKPNRAAVFAIQSALPKGVPRLTLRRNATNSASVIA